MRALFLFLLFVYSFSLNAQSWAESGATWHYSYVMMFGPGFTEIMVDGDSTIQGIETKKLTIRNHFYDGSNGQFSDYYPAPEYTYSDSDHVYHYINGEFKVLYDFSAQVGDTLTHHLYSYLLEEGCDSTGRSIVIDTGTELINGEELRWYEVEYLDGLAIVSGKIMEKLGGMVFMFPDINGCIATEEASGPLRCYQDDNFELYTNPEFEEECDFVMEYNYPIYFDNDPKWRLSRTSSVFATQSLCYETEDIVYYIHGDTTINDISYKVLFKRGVLNEFMVGMPDPNGPPCDQVYDIDEFAAFVRQEERRIYQYLNWDNEEVLLYDFELAVGDTIQGTVMSQSFGQDVVVTLVDSIWFYNEYLRVIHYEGSDVTDYFLEGVGHALGFLEAPSIMLDFSSAMYCYSQLDGIFLYTFDGGEWACDFSISIEEESKELSEVKLYPNPTDDKINIEILMSINTLSVSIYSTSGQLIKTKNIYDLNNSFIDVSDLESGMYLMEIFGDNQLRMVKPFTVK